MLRCEPKLYNCGYSRLKRVFRSNQNYNDYEKIVHSAKNKIIGNIPKELIEIILKKYPDKKAEVIKEVQQAFSNTALILKQCESLHIKCLGSIKEPKQEMDFIINSLLCKKEKSILQYTDKKQEAELLNQASQTLKNSLKGLLPDDAKVNISNFGSGFFGNIYKLEMKKGSENIIHPRVIKVYKDLSLGGDFSKVYNNKFDELLGKYSPAQISEEIKKHPLLSKRDVDIAYRELEMKMLLGDNYDSWDEDFIKSMLNMHGIYAEANSAFRLKDILGHNISKTNVVDFDLFDLDKKYAVIMCANNSLPGIKSLVNYDLLGLKYTDNNESNIVSGRYIDFGGIVLRRPEFSDKTCLKYFKKFNNIVNSKEQLKFLNRQLKFTENPKMPLRDKVLNAINIILDEHPEMKDNFYKTSQTKMSLKTRIKNWFEKL